MSWFELIFTKSGKTKSFWHKIQLAIGNRKELEIWSGLYNKDESSSLAQDLKLE